MKKIYNIYNSIKNENLDFTFDCKILPTLRGIKMVNITYINNKEIDKDLIFVKLSESSNLKNTIKNIWVPYNSLKNNISNSKYSIFMNKNNAIISKLLLEGFKNN